MLSRLGSPASSPRDQRRSPTPPLSSGVGLFVGVSIKSASLSSLTRRCARLGECFRISNLRWASYYARDAPLAASSRTDGCEDASTPWGSRPRSLAPNARPPAGSAGAGRPLRLTVSDRTRASPSCTVSGRPFLLSTSTCQARRPGIQSTSHLRLDAAASILAGETRPWQVAPMSISGRCCRLRD